MGGDGAHLGVNAERALETVIGGKESPTEEEGLTPQQMREWLMTLPKLDELEVRFERDEEGYGPFDMVYARGGKLDYAEGAGVAARAILEFWEEHPELVDTPIENVYAEDADWSSPTVLKDSLERPGLHEVMKDHDWDMRKLGLTGFMWGWAYNAARYCRDEPPQPNPAIITIGTGNPIDESS